MGQSVIPAENREKRCRSNPPKKGAEGEEVEVIELSPEDSLIFDEAILSPKLSPIMERAAALHRRLVINE
jgi:hypothetical protein